ncbi:Gfo/Idh/MocA family protein [Bifidobacterium catulorum]|uniref:Oxidoreductase n=1 Tax=Bifidobacterium catulorum TaxID=1630173 RepID=A0A2U2MST2_9BIFI|nr:Gfo/Idh/MocA family oxidoreductase [Bifidobacterium catulorum]PWG59903.1 oxidoreductase [Bifidobacterium catulorum]
MTESINAAFVGAGFMGRVHADAVRRAGGRLAAIVGANLEESAEAAERLGAERPYGSLEQVLADDSIDVVHILTPNFLHAEQAMQVIKAGKHVICEKPLAVTSQEAESLVAAANDAGVVAAVPFGYRFHPMVREARARLAGKGIHSFEASYLQDWLAGETDDWRVDSRSGGRSRAFADIGSHLVDMLEFVTGARIVRLTARTKIARPMRGGRPVSTEDIAVVVVELDNGAIGTLMVSQVAAGYKNQLSFRIGTDDETIGFDQQTPNSLWLGRVDAETTIQRDPARLSPDAARLCTIPSGHAMGYLDAVAGFVRDVYAAIGGHPAEGTPCFADGLRAVRITEAVLESAAANQWVDVPGTEE